MRSKEMSFQLTLKDILSLREIIMPVVCIKRKENFARWDNHRCAGRGKGDVSKDGFLCADCQTWKKLYDWYLHHRGLYRHNEVVKEYMRRHKFNGGYRLYVIFQRELSKMASEQKANLIVPIPVTPTTMRTYGLNQTIGLLHEVPYQSILRTKISSKTVQSSKTKGKRLATKQPFILDIPEKAINERALLVDNAYTTGRTLYHAVDLLKQAGCKEIGSVSLTC